MRYVWIKDAEEFRSIAAEWDNALLGSKEDNHFLLSDFILSWWKYYGGRLGMRILAAYDGAAISCGAAFFRNNRGYLAPIGGITANYTEFLNPAAGQYAWSAILGALKQEKGWRCLSLERARPRKIALGTLKEFASQDKGLVCEAYPSGCSYLIKVPAEFSGYINTIDETLRYYIKRSEKELERQGGLSLISLAESGRMGYFTDMYIRLSLDSFRRRGRKSAFENAPRRLFFKELMEKHSDSGRVDAHALKSGDRIIAMHFGYSAGNNLNYIFPVFDMDFARFNPGHLLIYKLVELAVKRKNDYIDLYSGENFYKEQWSNHRDELVSVALRPKRISCAMEGYFARQIRNSPAIKNIKRGLLRLRRESARIKEGFRSRPWR